MLTSIGGPPQKFSLRRVQLQSTGMHPSCHIADAGGHTFLKLSSQTARTIHRFECHPRTYVDAGRVAG
jgi:hypothetical protein